MSCKVTMITHRIQRIINDNMTKLEQLVGEKLENLENRVYMWFVRCGKEGENKLVYNDSWASDLAVGE